MVYDKQPQADVERIYDLYAKPNAFERVPYVLTAAVKAVVAEQSDPQIAAQMKAYRLPPGDRQQHGGAPGEGEVFRDAVRPAIKAEEDRKAKLAFK